VKLISRLICGLVINVQGSPSRFMDQLDRELAVYPVSSGKPDILIRFGQQFKDDKLADNPGIHSEYEDGFAANFGNALVRWRWGYSRILVDWFSPIPEKSWSRKALSMQFSHPYQEIGQIFHELVLIPTLQLFYSHHFLLLHGSALAVIREKKAVVFGGTGGAGKTSLELSLVGKKYSFMADDISFIDVNGTVWANFSWPKIYGYNTLGNDVVKSRVLTGRSAVDRLFWRLRMGLSGPDRVRRRVQPEIFYSGNVTQKADFSEYYILFRDGSPALAVRPLNTSTAVRMSLEVMASEYTILYRHLNWHKYNRLSLQQEPFITVGDIFDHWQVAGRRIFENIKCYMVHIPFDFSVSELKSVFPEMLIRHREST